MDVAEVSTMSSMLVFFLFIAVTNDSATQNTVKYGTTITTYGSGVIRSSLDWRRPIGGWRLIRARATIKSWEAPEACHGVDVQGSGQAQRPSWHGSSALVTAIPARLQADARAKARGRGPLRQNALQKINYFDQI
jgi:hypothetical protein